MNSPCPRRVSVYGKSKLAGEEFVKTIAPRYLIISSSWVYGNGDNFVTRLLKSAETQKVIRVQENQMGSPTSAKELAKVIYRLLEKDAYGLYHAVCGGVCSRYEFARRILTLAGKNTEILKADNAGENGHPSYAVLDNLMLRLDDIELPVSLGRGASCLYEQNAAVRMPGGCDNTVNRSNRSVIGTVAKGRGSMKKKKRNLTTIIFIALILGAAAGLALNLWAPQGYVRDEVIVNGIFYVIGQGFIRLMQMLVIPLVFCFPCLRAVWQLEIPGGWERSV